MRPLAQDADRERELAVAELGHELQALGYAFTTPTPETHRRVIARRSGARDLRDVFGWSLPFDEAVLPPRVFALLRRAGAASRRCARWRAGGGCCGRWRSSRRC